MYKLFLCSLLTLTVSISQAVLVKLPRANIINDRLQELGLGHFAEKTKLASKISEQELEAIGVAIAVELAILDYSEDPGITNHASAGIQALEPTIIRALLQHSPDAIHQLEILDILRPLPNFEEPELTNEQLRNSFTQQVTKLFQHQEKTLQSHLNQSISAHRQIAAAEQRIRNTERLSAQQAQEQINRERQLIAAHVRTVQESMHTYNNVAESFSGIAAIAAFAGNRHAAQQISAFGAGALKIYSGMDKLLNAASYSALGMSSASPFAAINPYIGIAMGIATIVSACMAEEDNSSEQLMEAINHAIGCLSRQMAQYHEICMMRFDRLESLIEAHHKAMMHGFFNVNQHQQDIKNYLRRLAADFNEAQQRAQVSLDYMHAHINSNQQSLLDVFRAENLRETDEIIANAKYAMQSNSANDELFEQHLQRLFIHATVSAKQANITGSAINPTDMSALDTTLSRSNHAQSFFGHPALGHINLLKNYVYPPNQVPSLVNPLVWIRCAETIVDMLTQKLQQDPNYLKNEQQRNLLLQRLDAIAVEGTQIYHFISRLHADPNNVANMLNRYQTVIQELKDHIAHTIAAYKAKRVEELRQQHTRALDTEKLALQTMPKIDHSKIINQAYESDGVVQYAKGNGGYEAIARRYNYYGRQVFEYPGLEGHPLLTAAQVKENIEAQQKRDRAALEASIESDGRSYLDATNLPVFENNQQHAQQPKPLSKLIYPQHGKTYTIPLRLPTNTYRRILGGLRSPLVATPFIIAELQNLGRLVFEYKIENSLFSLLVYFVHNNNNSKQLLGEYSKQCTLSNTSTNEEVDAYWNNNWNSIGTFKIREYQNTSYDLPIIPPQSKPGMRETFMAQATRRDPADHQDAITNMQNSLRQAQINEQRAVNAILAGQATAPGSILFTLLQKLDVCFNILDSLFILMYNEQYEQHEEFRLLHTQQANYVNNRQAILNYFAQYPQNNNLESVYLPQYLERTLLTVRATIGAITNLRLQPQFARLTHTLQRLHGVMQAYSQQVIQEQPLRRQQIREDDVPQQIVGLTNSNNTLREEVRFLRDQMQQMQNQMQQLLVLCQANRPAHIAQ